LSLTADTWYTAKVVVDDDPQNAALQRLRFWVDTDNDGDWSDETTLITSTAVDDDWSAGYVGLYKGAGDSTVQQFDDVKLGFDTERDQGGSVKGDGDILDAGDDVLVDDDFNSNQISLSYDNNGNLTDDGVYNYVYDAWNRLRKAQLVVGSDTTTIGEYEYYGDTRRSKKVVSNHGPEVVANDGGNTTVVFYYGGVAAGASPGRWNVFETRNGSNQTTFQHLWGTQYTDELIWIEKNGDPTEGNDTNPDDQTGESTADERYFVHQDRNWNVVALTEYDPSGTNNGRIVERYSYTPYGSFVVLNGNCGSGELDSVSLTSSVGNVFAHQGLPFDPEKASYQNRRREYAYTHERFGQRDPPYYLKGANLYCYVASNPALWSDPKGLTPFEPEGLFAAACYWYSWSARVESLANVSVTPLVEGGCLGLEDLDPDELDEAALALLNAHGGGVEGGWAGKECEEGECHIYLSIDLDFSVTLYGICVWADLMPGGDYEYFEFEGATCRICADVTAGISISAELGCCE
jgi:RHS repeat-associated protein